MIKSKSSIWISASFALFLAVMTTGCGTTTHDATFTQDFTPAESATIMVGEISDVAPKGDRGDQEDFDTEKELRTQLEAKLSENGMLATQSAEQGPYVLNAEITDYDPGSAGKRWIWPGYGATELSVQCTIYEGDQKVGNVFARRTIEAGGLYTAGAWKGVFESVAEDIVEELMVKLGA